MQQQTKGRSIFHSNNIMNRDLRYKSFKLCPRPIVFILIYTFILFKFLDINVSYHFQTLFNRFCWLWIILSEVSDTLGQIVGIHRTIELDNCNYCRERDVKIQFLPFNASITSHDLKHLPGKYQHISFSVKSKNIRVFISENVKTESSISFLLHYQDLS